MAAASTIDPATHVVVASETCMLAEPIAESASTASAPGTSQRLDAGRVAHHPVGAIGS
jgi:hypothetical protein